MEGLAAGVDPQPAEVQGSESLSGLTLSLAWRGIWKRSARRRRLSRLPCEPRRIQMPMPEDAQAVEYDVSTGRLCEASLSPSGCSWASRGASELYDAVVDAGLGVAG